MTSTHIDDPAAPFPTADNGVHAYFEDDEVLVFKNHGEGFWWGLMKDGGGFRVLTTAPASDRILPATRAARQRLLDERAGGAGAGRSP